MLDDAAPSDAPVLLERRAEGQIWVLTLNRPEHRNALNADMSRLLVQYFCEFRDDPGARVAVLTGAGDRAFCAGADLKARDRRSRQASEARPTHHGPRPGFMPLSERLGLWKPVIAAINGYAIAGGFALAMQADIRLMADDAHIGIAETRWNMPGAAWMAPLTRQIGLGNALELALWGDTQYTAQRAYEIGWVQRVVPPVDLMPTAMDYAERMLLLAPRAVANNKEMIYRGFYLDPMNAAIYGNWLEQNLVGMADSVEGPRAFAEKRKPQFRGQ